MKKESLFDELVKMLTPLEEYFEEHQREDGTKERILLRNKLSEDARKNNPKLLTALYQNEKLRKMFFAEIQGIASPKKRKVLNFNERKFLQLVNNKEFLPDSYTSFKTRIGLLEEEGDFINKSDRVVLSFPYKDCVLEAGMTKDDKNDKRDEIMFNDILERDKIDVLLDNKVFTNWTDIGGGGGAKKP